METVSLSSSISELQVSSCTQWNHTLVKPPQKRVHWNCVLVLLLLLPGDGSYSQHGHPTGRHVYATQSDHWVETDLYLKSYLLYSNACLMKLSPDLSCRTKVTLDTFIEKDHIEYQSWDLLTTMRGSLSHQCVEKICPFWKKGRKKNNSKSQLANKTYWPLCLLIIKNVYFEHPRFS